jgi:hypothetical protein
VDPDPQTLDATVTCTLPLGLGDATIDIAVTVDPQSQWEPNGAADVDLEADAVIPAALVNLLLGLDENAKLNISSLQADVAVGGATPNNIQGSSGPQSFDLVMDQDVVLTIAIPTQTLTSKGASPVTFRLDGFEAELTDVPLLDTIVVSDTTPPSTIDCELVSDTISFPVRQPR